MLSVMTFVNWFRVKSNAQMRQYDFADELTQMKVMKLLYYVQGTNLAVYDQKAFPNDILAWKYGPAIQEVHDRFAGKREIVGTITPEDLADYKTIEANSDLASVMDAVQTAFGDKSAIELMKQTHEERPWRETPQSGVIAPDLMKAYFKAEVVKTDE
ncbi:Panacea domain-containing protein [Secundilactobacillus muriivasis]